MTDSTDDTMQERIEESAIKFWLLTRVGRRTFAGGVSVAVFITLIAISTVAPVPMRHVIETADALWVLFSAMLTAIITAVALVVTFTGFRGECQGVIRKPPVFVITRIEDSRTT